ncbi:hypothetical protein ACFQ4K_01020 [Tistrella bauzanensis]
MARDVRSRNCSAGGFHIGHPGGDVFFKLVDRAVELIKAILARIHTALEIAIRLVQVTIAIRQGAAIIAVAMQLCRLHFKHGPDILKLLCDPVVVVAAIHCASSPGVFASMVGTSIV